MSLSAPAEAAPERAPRRQRLFFALWPDAAASSALATLADDAGLRRGKLVAPENLHITLFFLGDATPDQRACAERSAAEVDAPVFTLTLDRLGGFRRAGVLWSAPSDTPEPLSKLVAVLGESLAGCGFEIERRPYHAHVTLARKVRQRVAQRPHSPVVWTVDCFHLVRSRLQAQGARYQILSSWSLDGAGRTSPGSGPGD